MGASMLAYAFVIEGKHAASIPMFGFERRGAPVTASIRVDDQPIRDTHLIYEPDCSVILDPSFATAAATIDGLKGDGIVIVNSPKPLKDYFAKHGNVKCLGLVDATGIALEEINRPISNTCMLGAVAKATGWISLESVISCLEMSFKGEALKRNVRAVERGYQGIYLEEMNRGSS